MNDSENVCRLAALTPGGDHSVVSRELRVAGCELRQGCSRFHSQHATNFPHLFFSHGGIASSMNNRDSRRFTEHTPPVLGIMVHFIQESSCPHRRLALALFPSSHEHD
jgi:hypothetical protein